ncbi:MAG: thioredoxin family protein [Actinomycetia bacterium]|nr:thioredoxin family protein [Actinomycetes bacterium]
MKSVLLVKAAWCPICPQAEKLWNDLRRTYKFDYHEIDISSTEGEALVSKHSIMSVPTTIIDGKVAFVGVPDEKKAIQAIDR